MKKLFVDSWHGISFKEFLETSSTKLADEQFYKIFYIKFFEKKRSWNDMDPAWLQSKTTVAKKVMSLIPNKDAVILSVGSGLGIIEKPFLEAGYTNIHVNETKPDSLKWIQSSLKPENIHIGFLPKCLPPQQQFDAIYMILVDYCFTNDELVSFLHSMRTHLKKDGVFILSSAQCNQEKSFLKRIKTKLWEFLVTLSLKKADQFWGYLRTEKEFSSIFKKSKFNIVSTHKLENNVIFALKMV